MSIIYGLTFVCDNCSEEHLITGEYPAIPPHWITTQTMISNKDGYIPPHEDSHPIIHFCSQECFVEYAKSQEFKERILLTDYEEEDEDE